MSPTTQKRLNGKRNKKVERLLMTERPESQHIVNILYILTQYGQSRRGISPATNVMIYVYTYMRFIHMGFTHSQHNSLLHINWLCVSSLTNPHQLAKGRTILFFFFYPCKCGFMSHGCYQKWNGLTSWNMCDRNWVLRQWYLSSYNCIKSAMILG